MFSRLFSGIAGKEDSVIELKLGSVTPLPASSRVYVPNHKVVIGSEGGAYVSIQAGERIDRDRFKATVAASFPFIKGTWPTEFADGELRLFAADISHVWTIKSGNARLIAVPSHLTLAFFFDDKKQPSFAVIYYAAFGPGVGRIASFMVDPDSLRAILGSLHAADPGELNAQRVTQIRERAAAVAAAERRSVPQPPPPPNIDSQGSRQVTRAPISRRILRT